MDGSLLLVLCLLSVLTVFSAEHEYDFLVIDSKCRNSGVPGKCKKVVNCPIAMESLKKWHKHDLKRCGFDGFDEIVCCPSTSFREPDPFQRWGETSTNDPDFGEEDKSFKKYEQACNDIVNQTMRGIIFHIIDGDDAKEKEFPHMAALGYETDEGVSWDCGASIISNRYLLTAAHCFTGRITPTKARLGVTWLNDTNPTDMDIKNITMHHGYNPDPKHDDIAVVELTTNITFSDRIFPACLYSKDDDPLGLMVTGWGKTSIGNEDDRSNILQKAKLVAVPVEQCNETYVTRSSGSKTIESTQLCAAANTSDACWGDSGGPLQIKEKSGSYSIVGIVSYGAGCGGRVPGVYTRVSKYLDWIENIVWR